MTPMARKIGHRSALVPAVGLVCVAWMAACPAQPSRSDLDEAWWAATGPDGVQRVNIRCGPDFIDPRSIVVRANVPLQLSVSTTADLGSNNFMLAMGAATIDAPVRAAQTPFMISPRSSGRFQALCHDTSRPDSPAARRAKSGTITVLP